MIHINHYKRLDQTCTSNQTKPKTKINSVSSQGSVKDDSFEVTMEGSLGGVLM